MKNDKIERSVKRAFVNAAPYQLDKVTEKCKEQKGKVIPLENKQAKKSINKTFARIAAAAAALLLMIMGSYAYGRREILVAPSDGSLAKVGDTVAIEAPMGFTGSGQMPSQ